MKNFFEKIFVINLDRRRDRLDRFLSQFDWPGIGWNIDRFSAVDASIPENAPPEEWPQQPGAWGCLQSHHKIIKRGISAGWRNVLIFEDDAVIKRPQTFRRDIADCLAELPSDWQQFYLGVEHFNQPTDIPVVVSPRIHRTANGNRTHAYALTLEGMKIVDALFDDWKNWNPRWHCDWALGFRLHRTGKIRVYNTRPNLFIQDEGKSDIMDKTNGRKSFSNFIEDNRFVGPIRIGKSSVGYGILSLDGKSGYDGRRFKCSGMKTKQPISAHAPSRLEVSVVKTVKVRAVIDDAGKAWAPITAYVNGNEIGAVKTTGDKTKFATLHRGNHVLELRTDDNRAAMTAWDWMESDDQVIEIVSNCLCPNSCPSCNQAEFMAAEPDYEYTTEDAKALVDALEKYDKHVRVCFTGGEPALWSKSKEVMDVLNASEHITGTWVVTSRPEEEHIVNLESMFDQVYLSKRNDTAELIESLPLWLHGVTVWDQRKHAVPLSVPDVDKTDCCCANQGIVASITGKTIYTCVMARSLHIAGRWPELVGVSLDDYFTQGLPQPIGTAKACFGCVNNHAFRQVADKALT